MRKSDGLRVQYDKERWDESEGVTVDHEKNRDGVRVHHKNERWGES